MYWLALIQLILLLLLLLCCRFLVITVSTAAVQATMFIGQSILAFAVGSTPARTGDFYYLPGVAVGGGGGVSDGYVLTICNCCLLVCLFVLLPSCNLTVYCYHLLVYGCLIDGWIM